MYKNTIFLIANLFIASFMVSCSGDNSAQKEKIVFQKQIAKPFYFQKEIEVKPGLVFDVLAWRRGADLMKNAFLILRSDSTRSDYAVINGDTEGEIVDAWNMDLDTDGNPELFIESRGPKKELNLVIYEFDPRGNATKLKIPALLAKTKATYRGKDSIYVKNGSLFREFPTFEEADTSGSKVTGKKEIEYILRSNVISVK